MDVLRARRPRNTCWAGAIPGVYINEGIQIAQRQSLVTTDQCGRRSARVGARSVFSVLLRSRATTAFASWDFHLRDPDAGTVTGQFPQGYPIWIAIAYGLDGVTGTRRVIAWWAILGVLAVYFAAKRLIGPLPAAAAAGLLCVHVIQTWYARYPNSEIVTQALLFAALLAHAYAHEDDDRFFGPVAASLLGLALFTRFPVVLVVGAAVAASLARPCERPSRARRVSCHADGMGCRRGSVLHDATCDRTSAGPIAYVQSLEPIHLAALASRAAAVAALLWASRRPRVAAAIRTSSAGCADRDRLTGGGIYALFFREPGGRLAPHDAHAVRIFADLYFTRDRVRARAGRLCAGGVAIVLARARADSDDHDAGDRSSSTRCGSGPSTSGLRAGSSQRSCLARSSSHRRRCSRRSG